MKVFLRLSEANRKKHMQHSPWSKMWSVEYMEYSQALLLIILDALSFANIGISNLLGRPQTSERSAIDFGSYLYLILKLILCVRHVGIGFRLFRSCLPSGTHGICLRCLHVVHAILACLKISSKNASIASEKQAHAGSKGSAPYLHLQTHGDPHFPFLALVSIFTFCTASTSDMPYEVTLLMSGHRELLTLSDRKFWTSCVCRQCMSYLESPMKEEQKYITEKGLELRPIFQVSKNMIIYAHYAGSMICTFLVLHIPSFAQIFHSALWCPVSSRSDLQLEN